MGRTTAPSSFATLTPAYLKDYKSKKALLEEFRAGKDFVYNHGVVATYISIRDYDAGQMVKFRYNNLRHACFYTITDDDKKEVKS